MAHELMNLDLFVAAAKSWGFDLVQPFSLDWLDDDTVPFRLPDFGRGNAMGVIVGNTRALWPRFMRALRDDVSLRREEHPLDMYVVRSIGEAARQIPVANVVFWAHEIQPEPMPVQRIAEAAGLAKISPSHLSIHPRFGPWIALRAVLMLDAEGPISPRIPALDFCSGCTSPCVKALERALDASGTNERELQGDPTAVARAWRAWLEVRSVCPVGSDHRYDEEQAEYHYAKRLPLLCDATDAF
jgi:methylmalonic aciduria homocystinuria type C protein